jgi:hypothetical protein
MDYTLLRLRSVLFSRSADSSEMAEEWRLAESVSEFDDLPLDKDGMSDEARGALAKLLAKSQIEVTTIGDHESKFYVGPSIESSDTIYHIVGCTSCPS